MEIDENQVTQAKISPRMHLRNQIARELLQLSNEPNSEDEWYAANYYAECIVEELVEGGYA